VRHCVKSVATLKFFTTSGTVSVDVAKSLTDSTV